MALLARDLPQGVTWNVPYDTTPFITASIIDVVKTLIEAIALVFVVMLIFLQNLRATIIPTLVIPVALLGTFIGLSVLHFSINQLTLFGMVLAIGIVVDDAIVVIENVERIMDEEHLEPRAATRKAMGQITGAIIAITVVLAAVFVPSALQPGATGIIYSQFALTIAVSMAILRVPGAVVHALAVRGDPAADATKEARRTSRFRWFNHGFDWVGQYLCRPCRRGRAARAALDDGVRAGRGAGRIPVHAPADQLRPRRGSGLHAGAGQSAVGRNPAAHRSGHGQGARQAAAQRDRQGHRGHILVPKASASSGRAKTSAWPSSSWRTGASAPRPPCS